MAKRARYTYEAGRLILRDGERFFNVAKSGDTSPTEADALVHFLVDLLNAADEDDDTFEDFYDEYMSEDYDPEGGDDGDEEE